VEITALHAGILALARGRGRAWIAVSWALAATHLGLLEERDRLSAADTLTLCRANLPALGRGCGRWVGVAAIASDVADGRVARRTGTASPFGAYADTFADAAFWTWLALRHEPDRRWRAAAIAAWVAPVAVVTVISVARGRIVEVPRSALLRPAAALQAVIALRRLLVRPGR